MRTAPIQHKQAPQPSGSPVLPEQSANLYDEFSQTLDQIASKVLRSQQSEAAMPNAASTPKLTVKTAKNPVPHSDTPKVEREKPRKTSEQPKPTSEKSEKAVATPKDPSEESHDSEPVQVHQESVQAESSEVDTAQNAQKEAKKGASDAEVSESNETEKQDAPVQEQVPTTEAQNLAARVDLGSGAPDTSKQEEIEVVKADSNEGDAPVNEEQEEAAVSDTVDTGPQLASSDSEKLAVDSKSEVSTESPQPVPMQTTDATPASTEQTDTPQEASQDVTQGLTSEAVYAQLKGPETQDQGAKQAQDLLTKTLERIIQSKLLEASNAQVAGAQRDSAFQIAREAQRAQTVIAQLNQGVTGTALKAGVPAQTQAHGLQFNDTGAFRQAESARGDEPKGSATLTRPQAVRTMERVENALKEVSKSKDGKTISVRLDPPELGTVKVDVSYKDGGIHARIAAEQGSVVHLLKERTHELVVMIRKLGLNVEKVTVTVSSQDQNAGTLGSFESFKDGSSASNQGQQGGRRFGVEQGVMEKPTLSPAATDDHWIA